MRFIADGPSIPNELLLAQDEGRVIFFCGSGVSRASAGLPDFFGLAAQVLKLLNANDRCEAARLLATVNGAANSAELKSLLSADRLFNLLRRDFDAKEIERAVAQSLVSSADVSLGAHRTMLRLATGQDGSVRLVTTNFDRLFEQCDPRLKFRTSTRTRLPRLEFEDDDWGIVHLHGRVLEDYSGADSDGFVLSSAEFGDAYLAHGWARDFVRRLLDRYVAVFVGYSADDPPMRYLLEGLQQQSTPRSRRIFAFQAGPEDIASALWEDKGVEAIAYRNDDAHTALWRTLEAWATRSRSPAKWRRRVFSLARKGPENVEPHVRGMMAHIVSTKVGAMELAKSSSKVPPSWLCVFDRQIRFAPPSRTYNIDRPDELIDQHPINRLDSDPAPLTKNDQGPTTERVVPQTAWDAFAVNDADLHEARASHVATVRGQNAGDAPDLAPRLSALSSWIGRNAHDRTTVWWAARQPNLHPDLIHQVRVRLGARNEKRISPVVRRAWGLVFEAHATPIEARFERYQFKNDIEAVGWNSAAARRYGRIFRPRLVLKPVFRPTIAPSAAAPLRDLIHIDVEYPASLNEISVRDAELAQVLRELRLNLELSLDYEAELGGWLHLCAIEPDQTRRGDEFSRSYQLSGYALHFVALFRRLVAFDATAARNEFAKWRRSDKVFSRLRFWAAALPDVATAEEFADEVLSLSRQDFWDLYGERDLLIVLARRWADVPARSRKEIEKRINAGPPPLRRYSADKRSEYAAVRRLNRLYWLSRNGCSFSFDVNARITNLRAAAPDWKDEFGAHAADSLDGRSGWVEQNKDWSELASVPLANVFDLAQELGRRDSFGDLIERAPFAGLSEARPLRAISALTLAKRHGKFSAAFWSAFLNNETRKKDRPRLKLLIAGRLAALSPLNLAEILLSAARWFEQNGQDARVVSPTVFARLWAAFLTTLQHGGATGVSALVRSRDADWLNEAINAPAGCLAELLMDEPNKKSFSPGNGFPKETLDRADSLLSLSAPSRQYAMAIFGQRAGWLHYLHPEWADKRLISLVTSGSDLNDDFIAVMSGLLSGGQLPPPLLYRRLKPALFRLAMNHKDMDSRYREPLAGMLLAGWGSKDASGERYVLSDEMRDVLLETDDEFRCSLLFDLRHWSSEERWSDQLAEFLGAVWPRNKKARSGRVSAALCNLAFAQKRNYAEISKAAARLVIQSPAQHLHFFDLDDESEAARRGHPNETITLLHAVLPQDPRYWPYGAPQLIADLSNVKVSAAARLKLNELQMRLSDAA